MFSCEFCEISKNTFFYRIPLVAACVVIIRYIKSRPVNSASLTLPVLPTKSFITISDLETTSSAF